jgi:hypothetical protein
MHENKLWLEPNACKAGLGEILKFWPLQTSMLDDLSKGIKNS